MAQLGKLGSIGSILGADTVLLAVLPIVFESELPVGMPTFGLTVLLVVDEPCGHALLTIFVPHGAEAVQFVTFEVDPVVILAFRIPSASRTFPFSFPIGNAGFPLTVFIPLGSLTIRYTGLEISQGGFVAVEMPSRLRPMKFTFGISFLDGLFSTTKKFAAEAIALSIAIVNLSTLALGIIIFVGPAIAFSVSPIGNRFSWALLEHLDGIPRERILLALVLDCQAIAVLIEPM